MSSVTLEKFRTLRGPTYTNSKGEISSPRTLSFTERVPVCYSSRYPGPDLRIVLRVEWWLVEDKNDNFRLLPPLYNSWITPVKVYTRDLGDIFSVNRVSPGKIPERRDY